MPCTNRENEQCPYFSHCAPREIALWSWVEVFDFRIAGQRRSSCAILSPMNRFALGGLIAFASVAIVPGHQEARSSKGDVVHRRL